jgi:hypothetical protein
VFHWVAVSPYRPARKTLPRLVWQFDVEWTTAWQWHRHRIQSSSFRKALCTRKNKWVLEVKLVAMSNNRIRIARFTWFLVRILPIEFSVFYHGDKSILLSKVNSQIGWKDSMLNHVNGLPILLWGQRLQKNRKALKLHLSKWIRSKQKSYL